MSGKIEKVILVFKTHFDIGFTDLSGHVLEQYARTMLDQVIETCAATRHMGKRKYVWTMPAWPLKETLRRCSPEKKALAEQLIQEGQLVWHALPFTMHTDLCGPEDLIESLYIAKELSETYQKPYPIAAKMTDVPGHNWQLPAILSGAGVRFLHLGCNEFSTPPKVPFLFYWEAPSGERILTMYSAGGYGTSLLPPDDWEYPVWMALMNTNDNHGPQSVKAIEEMVGKLQENYPEAEVVCGSMDDFYYELSKQDLIRLPVVSRDLADTWIQGAGSYPKEVSKLRRLRQKSRQLQAWELALWLSKKEERQTAKLWRDYYEQVVLFEEHTWGADVKTWLGPGRAYEKQSFAAERKRENYLFMEASWEEQRERIKAAKTILHEIAPLAKMPKNAPSYLYHTRGEAYTGWVFFENKRQTQVLINGKACPVCMIDGRLACYVEELPPFTAVPYVLGEELQEKEIEEASGILENHRYRLRINKKEGSLLELYDKSSGQILLQACEGIPVLSYQYRKYGTDQIHRFLKQYGYHYTTWGIQDFGREGYPECREEFFSPVLIQCRWYRNKVQLWYEGDKSVSEYGDASQIVLEIVLPPAGDEIFVTLHLKKKQETPFIESGSLVFPADGEPCTYLIQKSGCLLDPKTDIQPGANHVLYCMERGFAIDQGAGGLCVLSEDAPLVSFGSPGIYEYQSTFSKPKSPVAYVNLFNNMWGTNFPQWIGGDFSYRFVLFGYQKAEEKQLLEQMAERENAVFFVERELKTPPIFLPENVELIHVRRESRGMILYLRSLEGSQSKKTVHVPGHWITLVDLLGENQKGPVKEQCEVWFPACGIAALLLQE